MQRKKGFLNLNKILKRATIEILSTKAITKIGAPNNHWIKVDNKKIFIKDYDGWQEELICCEFLKLLGIESIEYDIAIINDDKYIISSDYRKENCDYISGATIIDDFYKYIIKEDPTYFSSFNIKENECIEKVRYSLNNLENIWQALAFRYQGNLEKDAIVANLISELEKRFLVRSILLMDNDYHPDNWCIEEGERIKLVPNYDFGSCLKDNNFFGMPFGVFSEDAGNSHKEQLKAYLTYTAKENIEEFIKLFEKATPELFSKSVTLVEEKIGIKLENRDRLINTYKDNYNEILDIIINYRGRYGR